MWTGACQARNEGLKNVAFLRTNIELLPHFFATGEVAEIWITFPDPQMKKVRKRLTSTRFLELYREVLKPEGIVHLKTDSPFLYTYTQAMVKENSYLLLVDTCDLYNTDQTLGIVNQESDIEEARALQTHYEHQWLDRGLTIKYLRWQLPANPSLIEPEIEIEKDSYRSYGRNYVSTTNN
jgi:tRNA (guanine-N7-)-methyltransferase